MIGFTDSPDHVVDHDLTPDLSRVQLLLAEHEPMFAKQDSVVSECYITTSVDVESQPSKSLRKQGFCSVHSVSRDQKYFSAPPDGFCVFVPLLQELDAIFQLHAFQFYAFFDKRR